MALIGFRYNAPGSGGDYAGKCTWEVEVAGWPVIFVVSGYADAAAKSPDRGEWKDMDAFLTEPDWYRASCTAVGRHGLCELCSSEFGDYHEAVAYLADAIARVEEGEFDDLLGREG